MDGLIQSEIILFACVFNHLRNNVDPYPPKKICDELMSLYPWTNACIDNRVAWYAVSYYAGDSFHESSNEKHQYLYQQLAHLIHREQQTKTICIDPVSLDTSKKISLSPEIASLLRLQIKKD